MASFDTDERQGIWFEMEGGGRVCLKLLSATEWKKIRKATVTNKPFIHEIPGQRPQVMTYEDTDTDLQSDMINDATIVGWENLFDKNGSPIPCTRGWKIQLMYMDNPTFRDFINEKLALLREMVEVRVEEATKNS